MTRTNPRRGRVRITSREITPATFNCSQLLKQRRQSQAHILPLLLFRARSNTSLGPRFHPNLQTSVMQRGMSMTWLASLVGTLHPYDLSPLLPFFALWAPWTQRWWCLSPYWYLPATGLLTAAVWFSGPAIIISWWVLFLTSLHGNHFSTVHYDLFPELAMASDERCLLNFSMENLACLVWTGLEPRSFYIITDILMSLFYK